jgi:large subunit ribosomal protein L25
MKKTKLTLKVTKRDVFGKKLKKSRKEGKLPANIFGQGFKSQAVFVDYKEFSRIFKIAKETGVVYLELSKEEIPVLIQNLQTHPINDQLLHVDFRKVDLTKKIETAVPVKTVGVSEAVAQKGGVLLTQADELKVEAQPEKIPHQIEIDLSVLKEINQEIKVADLPQNPDYKIIDPADKVIVSVVAHKEETVVPETTSAPPEIITEKEEPTKETPSSSSNDSEKTKEEKKQ